MKVKHKTVVSLSTQYYKRGDTLVVSKNLRTLKRQSTGFDILNEEILTDLEYAHYIDGINTLPDGVYQLEYTGISTDYETGHTENDGYILKSIEADKE